jgi:voltage-gated potassium channel
MRIASGRSAISSIASDRERRQALRRLRAGLAVLAALTGIGTLGFRHLAGMNWIDSVYMTVTTLATVGYGEVQPLGPSARVFATIFILAGVGATLYTVGVMAEFVIAGRIGELLGRRAMERTLGSLRDHVIVCGYGRLGGALAEELARSGVPIVVVDEDIAVGERIAERGWPFVCASAVDEGVLERAGIARARAIVAATGSEAVNVFIALAAREANAGIAIHARAETASGARRLRSAGAQSAVSPHAIGGERLAQAILRPAVVDFMQLSTPGSGTEIDLEEVVVAARSPLAGLRIEELAERGARVSVVAIKRAAAPLMLDPAPASSLEAEDRVVVIGDRESVRRLADLAAAPTDPTREVRP